MGEAVIRLAQRVLIPRHKRVTSTGKIIDVESHVRMMRGPSVSLESPSVSGGKFWKAKLNGNKVTTQWGKLNTNGQTKEFTFDTPAEATMYYTKKVNEKYNKGYLDAGTGNVGWPSYIGSPVYADFLDPEEDIDPNSPEAFFSAVDRLAVKLGAV